jgi:hypothetical protein
MARQRKASAKTAKRDTVAKAKRGRPSLYTRELADIICSRMAGGETLNQICRDPSIGVGAQTVRDWAIQDVDGFSVRYARAREQLMDFWEDEAIEIADDGRNDWEEREGKRGETYIALNKEAIDRSKLRVDTRKWLLTKLRPTRFGDKIDLKHDGTTAFLTMLQHITTGGPATT